VWVWTLPLETRPVEDLIKLARLLSGDRVGPASGLRLPHSESLKEIWAQLRARYASEFQVSDENIAAWHNFEAEESELLEQWPGAVFHLEQLLQMRPGDQSVEERLARAQAKIPNRH
jgi:hypothetical protein